jgi:hypothetical protein
MIIPTCEVYLLGTKGVFANTHSRTMLASERQIYYGQGCNVHQNCDDCDFEDCQANLVSGRMIVPPNLGREKWQ